MIRSFLAGIYTYAHTANRGGKGEGVSAAAIALMQGREHLQGYRGMAPIVVPRLRPPVVGVLAGESYKAMSLASIKTIRKLLGSRNDTLWREEHAGNPDYVSRFLIKHSRSSSPADWSMLYVFPYDGALPEGGGLDFWWCDEPPPPRFISTLGSRIEAGHLLRQIITATPQEKSKWYPISREFADVGNSGHLTRWPDREVRGNRMRIRWASDRNEALSDHDLEQLRANARGRPFEQSITQGLEIDVHGGCPWPENLLMEAMGRCQEPLRVERVTIEGGADGSSISADLQVWEDAFASDPYYSVGDPAKGIRDGHHDPDGMHVYNRRTGHLAARLVGYLGGWGLGNLMSDMHRRYNGAVLDPLVTGGYGEALLQAIRKRRIGEVALVHSKIERRPGEWETVIGTVETEEMRGKMVGGVEREILTGKLNVPAVEVVQALMDMTVDENGKYVAIGKKHLPEDVACHGRWVVYSGQHEWQEPRQKPNEHPIWLRDPTAVMPAMKVPSFRDILDANGSRPGPARPKVSLENFEGP